MVKNLWKKNKRKGSISNHAKHVAVKRSSNQSLSKPSMRDDKRRIKFVHPKKASSAFGIDDKLQHNGNHSNSILRKPPGSPFTFDDYNTKKLKRKNNEGKVVEMDRKASANFLLNTPTSVTNSHVSRVSSSVNSLEEAVKDRIGCRPRSNSTDGELNLPQRGKSNNHSQNMF